MTMRAHSSSAKAAAVAPAQDAGAIVQAGLDAHRAGQLDRAERLYAQAMRVQPNHADALNLAGVLAFTRGHTEEAIRLIGKAVRVLPSHVDAHMNLAEAMLKAGRLAEAADSYRRVVALRPDFAEAHAHLGRVLGELRPLDVALGHCRVAVALAPEMAEAQAALGLTLRRLGRLEDAAAAYSAALRLQPDDAGRLNEFGTLLTEMERTEEALAVHRRAAELRPDDAAILTNLAISTHRAGDPAAAAEAFGRAVRLAPGFLDAWLGHAGMLRALGRFDEAASCYRHVLELDPNNASALHGLAHIRHEAGERSDVERLERMLARPRLSPLNRVIAGFALGKLLADDQRFDEAFARFAAANAQYRKIREDAGQHFDGPELVQSVAETLGGSCREQILAMSGWGNPSDMPVFVVGMPRSGTSLVEQICASHSQVFGAGELRDLIGLGKAMADYDQSTKAALGAMPDFVRGLADRHLARLAALGGGAARVIDKAPFNVLRVPLIHALFPRARVIMCSRDPRDVAVSNHTMFFREGNLWSTDLADCGVVCREVARLAAFWQTQAPVRILEVGYETLVGDLEGQARRMIDFLGLDWEPACLDFHRTVRAVTTPSDWQVRQPVSGGAVGRWRRYERHLGKLFDALGLADAR